MTTNDEYVETMVQHYAVAALWSTTIYGWEGYEGEPLDTYFGVGDIHPDVYAAMAEDCRSFVEAAGRDIGDMSPEQAGHDFWLTRNRHGAGFWDRGLGARGERLSDLARPYGEVDLWTDGEYVRA